MIKALLITLLTATLAHGQYDARTADYLRAWRIGAASQVAFPTNGLVAYWSMDSVSGTTVFDTFGSRDMTALGTPSFVSGKHFDSYDMGTANENYGELQAALPNGTNYTFRAWVKPNKTAMNLHANGGWIASDRSGTASGTDWSLNYRTSDQTYTFAVFGNPHSLVAQPLSTNVLHNTWQHVVGVCDASNGKVKLWVDGVKSEEILTFIPNDGSTLPFRIGQASWTLGADLKYHGEIDEVAFWTRALTDDEVVADYNDGKGRFYIP